MEESLFLEYVKKYFPGIVVRVVTTLNGEDRQPTYLFRSMLRRVLSLDGNWQSFIGDNVNVAADIVAMDSQLPLKTRPSLGQASGEVPKIGMELYLNETQLTKLDYLVATGAPVGQIIAILFDDTGRCIVGIYEQLEALFLTGLSTGEALNSDKGTGLGVRLNYGYLSSNKFGVPVVLSTANLASATPIADGQAVIDAARDKGRVISYAMLDKTTFELMRRTTETKDLYAVSVGNFSNTKPIPSKENFQTFLEGEWGVALTIIDRSVTFEKNKVKTIVKPWSEGKIVFLTSLEVGNLVWSPLAEERHRDKAVEYQVVDDFILLSKGVNRSPLREFTSSQARVVPVISNVDQIYLLDTKTVQA